MWGVLFSSNARDLDQEELWFEESLDVTPRAVSPNPAGQQPRSNERMAGMQAQMTPTSTSIVLQYPTST